MTALFTRKDVAAAGVFTAFVATATMLINVFVSATGGFFNVGEIMVYTTALLMGPWIGAFAGGLGSMIADISLGYAQFAPGTLVIKGIEGFVVGYLAKKGSPLLSKGKWKVISASTGAAVALIVWIVGSTYYVGESEVSLGLPFVGYATFSMSIPGAFWIGLALLVFGVSLVAGILVEPTVGWLALAVLAGGFEMVFGYYLYERLVLGQIGAIAEVPVNIGQMTVGLLVALPLARSVGKLIGGFPEAPREA